MDAARSLVAATRAAIEAAESSVAPTAAAAAVDLSNEANDFVSLATATAENFRRRRRRRDINDLFERPSKNELRSQLFAIGRQLLVVRPRELHKLMRKGIPHEQLNIFWTQLTIARLEKSIELQWPTPELKYEEPLTNAQERTLYYLQVDTLYTIYCYKYRHVVMLIIV